MRKRWRGFRADQIKWGRLVRRSPLFNLFPPPPSPIGRYQGVFHSHPWTNTNTQQLPEHNKIKRQNFPRPPNRTRLSAERERAYDRWGNGCGSKDSCEFPDFPFPPLVDCASLVGRRCIFCGFNQDLILFLDFLFEFCSIDSFFGLICDCNI